MPRPIWPRGRFANAALARPIPQLARIRRHRTAGDAAGRDGRAVRVGDDVTASTGGDQKPWLFKPGQSGNPAGRPKGSKQKLCEDFLGDVLDAWTASGKAAIEAMIADKPGDFVKMVAGLVPKEATLNINNTDDLSDAELAERIRTITATLAPFLADGVGIAPEGDAGQGGAQQPARVH